MLNKIAIYPSNHKDMELYKFLSMYSPYPIELNPEIKSIQSAQVFISKYHHSYFNFNNTNELIFLCRNQFSNKEMLLLNLIDSIIVNTYYDGLTLSWRLQNSGYHKHIVPLLPWCPPGEITEGIHLLKSDNKFKKAFSGYKVSNDPNSQILVYLSENDYNWSYKVIEGMVNGAIPIILDRPPLNELIIHGFNGFLIRHPGDIVKALRTIEDEKMWLTHNVKSSINSYFESTRYFETLTNLKTVPGVIAPTMSLAPNERTWLVRERIFKNGEVTYFPNQYRANLTLIDLNNAQEVLNYFLTQEFSNVYVFGCDIPEFLDKRDELRLLRMLKKMGSRSLKIHFCRDDAIPKPWESIFAHLSIISIEEGMKQVLN